MGDSTRYMTSNWMPRLNAVLGSLVVGVGAWLAWGSLSPTELSLVLLCVAGFLLWRGHTIGLVWAWSTLLLGLECFVWPLITMVEIRSATAEPTDEQMGTILSALLMGLFSAVFWLAFSYGLFKRAAGGEKLSIPPSARPPTQSQSDTIRSRKKQ